MKERERKKTNQNNVYLNFSAKQLNNKKKNVEFQKMKTTKQVSCTNFSLFHILKYTNVACMYFK